MIALLLLWGCGEPPEVAPGTDREQPLVFDELEVDADLRMVTNFQFLPDSDELLVLEKAGRALHLRLDGDRAETVATFELPVHSESECGLLSLAFAPDFATSRHVYLGSCRSQTTIEVRRVTLGPDPAATAVEILVAEAPGAERSWHNIGSMGFEDDDTLWVAVGDKSVRGNGQDTSTRLGGLLRIRPRPEGGYDPAPDNPFAGGGGAPELYAWGLRSPWRALRDRQGRYWVGDVGGDAVEEINVFSAAGTNLGWATHEGACGNCPGFTDPVTSWRHPEVSAYMLDDPDVVPTTSRVAWVGTEVVPHSADPYDGLLDDAVLFGDYCLGYVRAMRLTGAGAVVGDVHVAHLPLSVAWDQGTDGYVYAATFGECRIHTVDESEPPESRLFRMVAREGE